MDLFSADLLTRLSKVVTATLDEGLLRWLELCLIYNNSFVIVRNWGVCGYKRGIDGIIGLLIICTHHSELQAITALLIISTSSALAKSLPAHCVLTSRSLTTAPNNGDFSAFRAQVLLSQPPVQNSTLN
jgi:hypothetical protein